MIIILFSSSQCSSWWGGRYQVQNGTTICLLFRYQVTTISFPTYSHEEFVKLEKLKKVTSWSNRIFLCHHLSEASILFLLIPSTPLESQNYNKRLTQLSYAFASDRSAMCFVPFAEPWEKVQEFTKSVQDTLNAEILMISSIVLTERVTEISIIWENCPIISKQINLLIANF